MSRKNFIHYSVYSDIKRFPIGIIYPDSHRSGILEKKIEMHKVMIEKAIPGGTSFHSKILEFEIRWHI